MVFPVLPVMAMILPVEYSLFNLANFLKKEKVLDTLSNFFFETFLIFFETTQLIAPLEMASLI